MMPNTTITRMVVLLLTMTIGLVGCQQPPGSADPDNNPPVQPTPKPDPGQDDTPTPPNNGDNPDPGQGDDNPGDDQPNPDQPDPADPGNDNPDPADPGDDVPDPADPQDARIGAWKVATGKVFRYYGTRETFELAYMSLDPSGKLELTLRDPATGILSCEQGVYTFPNADSILVQVGGAELIRTEFVEDGVLAATDANGDAATFIRESEIPQDMRCQEFDVVRRIDDFGQNPQNGGGAAFDGTSLRFNAYSGNIEEFDPVLDQFHVPMPPPVTNRDIHAAQGETYWYACGCVSERLATRRTQGGARLDDVTLAELGLTGNSFTTDAVAYDPTQDVLYLFVRDINAGENLFFKVDAAAEPDVLLQTTAFRADFLSLAFDGANLWGIDQYGSAVVRIDTETFQAVATYNTPDREAYFSKIAADGDSLYMLGSAGEPSRGIFFELRNDSAADQPDEPEMPEPFELFGVWELADGSILVDEAGRSIDILDLDENGIARIVYTVPETGMVMCFEGTAALAGEELTLHFDEVQGIEDILVIRTVEMPEAHTLKLSDAQGQESTFNRRRGLPERFQCRNFDVLKETQLPAVPSTYSGLAFDGDLLWYSDSPLRAIAVNPETGALVATNGFPSEMLVQAIAGPDFWTIGTDRPRKIQRVTAAGVIADELAVASIDIEAMAVDPLTGHVWLTGQQNGTGDYYIQEFDVALDPNKQKHSRRFPRHLGAIASDGDFIWAITGRSVIQIEPREGRVAATYEPLSLTRSWMGIESVGESLYLVGYDHTTQTGVMVELAPEPF